jgi:hypothetical protein
LELAVGGRPIFQVQVSLSAERVSGEAYNFIQSVLAATGGLDEFR